MENATHHQDREGGLIALIVSSACLAIILFGFAVVAIRTPVAEIKMRTIPITEATYKCPDHVAPKRMRFREESGTADMYVCSDGTQFPAHEYL